MQATQTSIAKGLLLGMACLAVSSTSVATTPGAKRSDFNGDGRSDILWRFVLPRLGGDIIWLSANATTQMQVTHMASSWRIAGLGDYNGDGRTDILWRNDDGSEHDLAFGLGHAGGA